MAWKDDDFLRGGGESSYRGPSVDDIALKDAGTVGGYPGCPVEAGDRKAHLYRIHKGEKGKDR